MPECSSSGHRTGVKADSTLEAPAHLGLVHLDCTSSDDTWVSLMFDSGGGGKCVLIWGMSFAIVDQHYQFDALCVWEMSHN